MKIERRRMKPGEKTISLEEYVDFSVSEKFTGFTISYLNQIIRFHGFRKLHKSHKKIVGEAVKALDLLDLSRSTLKQSGISSSSSASLTLDEVITDIEALKWQECFPTSLQIINSDQVTRSVTKPNKRKKASTKKLLEFDEDDESRTKPRKKKMKKKNEKVSDL